MKNFEKLTINTQHWIVYKKWVFFHTAQGWAIRLCLIFSWSSRSTSSLACLSLCTHVKVNRPIYYPHSLLTSVATALLYTISFKLDTVFVELKDVENNRWEFFNYLFFSPSVSLYSPWRGHSSWKIPSTSSRSELRKWSYFTLPI